MSLISSAILSTDTDTNTWDQQCRCARLLAFIIRNEIKGGSAGAVLGHARFGVRKPRRAKALTRERLPITSPGLGTTQGSGDSKPPGRHTEGALTERSPGESQLCDGKRRGQTRHFRAQPRQGRRGAGRRGEAAFEPARLCSSAGWVGRGGRRSMGDADGLRQRRPLQPQVVADDGQTPEVKDGR